MDVQIEHFTIKHPSFFGRLVQISDKWYISLHGCPKTGLVGFLDITVFIENFGKIIKKKQVH